MKTKAEIWARVERDQVLNLGELAVASGYPRSALGAMKLPLIGGKISLSDFKRILRQRQDQRENLPAAAHARNGDNGHLAKSSPAPALGRDRQTSRAADLFFGTKRIQNRLTGKRGALQDERA